MSIPRREYGRSLRHQGRQAVFCMLCLAIASILAGAGTQGGSDTKAGDVLKVYEVNKRVSDFPEEEDFSTQETAYAAINCVLATGDDGGADHRRG